MLYLISSLIPISRTENIGAWKERPWKNNEVSEFIFRRNFLNLFRGSFAIVRSLVQHTYYLLRSSLCTRPLTMTFFSTRVHRVLKTILVNDLVLHGFSSFGRPCRVHKRYIRPELTGTHVVLLWPTFSTGLCTS